MDKTRDGKLKLPANFVLRRTPRRLTTALFHLPPDTKIIEEEKNLPSSNIRSNIVNNLTKQSDGGCQNQTAKIEKDVYDSWDSGSDDDTVKQQRKKSDSNCKTKEKGSDSGDWGSSDKTAAANSHKWTEMKGVPGRPFGNMPQDCLHQQQRQFTSQSRNNELDQQRSNQRSNQQYQQMSVPFQKRDPLGNPQKQSYGCQQQSTSKQQWNNKSSDQRGNQDNKFGQRQQGNNNSGQVNNQGQNGGQQRQLNNKPGEMNQGQNFGNQRQWGNESQRNKKYEGDEHQQHWGNNNTFNQENHLQGSNWGQRRQGPIYEKKLPSSHFDQQLAQKSPQRSCEFDTSSQSKCFPPNRHSTPAPNQSSTNQRGFGSKRQNQHSVSSGTDKMSAACKNQMHCPIENGNMLANQRLNFTNQRGSGYHKGRDTQEAGAVGYNRKEFPAGTCWDQGDRFKRCSQGTNGGKGEMKQWSNGIPENRFGNQRNQGYPNQRHGSFNNNGGIAKPPVNYMETPLNDIIKWLDGDRRQHGDKATPAKITVEQQVGMKDENGSCTNPSETYDPSQISENNQSQGGYSAPVEVVEVVEPTATVMPETIVTSEVFAIPPIRISQDEAVEPAAVVELKASVAEQELGVNESKTLIVDTKATTTGIKAVITKPEVTEIPVETVIISQKPSVTLQETNVKSPKVVVAPTEIAASFVESIIPSPSSAAPLPEPDVSSSKAVVASPEINVIPRESPIPPLSTVMTSSETNFTSPKNFLTSSEIVATLPESTRSAPLAVETLIDTGVNSPKSVIALPEIIVTPTTTSATSPPSTVVILPEIGVTPPETDTAPLEIVASLVASVIPPPSIVLTPPETGVASTSTVTAPEEADVISADSAIPPPPTVVNLPENDFTHPEVFVASSEVIFTSQGAAVPSVGTGVNVPNAVIAPPGVTVTGVAHPKLTIPPAPTTASQPEAVGTLPTVVVTPPEGIDTPLEAIDALAKIVAFPLAAVIPSRDDVRRPQEDGTTFQGIGESKPGAAASERESETAEGELKAARIDLKNVVAKLEVSRNNNKAAENNLKEFPEVRGKKDGSLSFTELVDIPFETSSTPLETAVSSPVATVKNGIEIEATPEENLKHVECTSTISSQDPKPALEQETSVSREQLDEKPDIDYGNTSGYGFLDLEEIHRKIFEESST